MPMNFASPHYDRASLMQPLRATDPLALLDAALAAAHDAGRESMHAGRRVFQEQADAKAAEARAAVIAALGLQARRAASMEPQQ